MNCNAAYCKSSLAQRAPPGPPWSRVALRVKAVHRIEHEIGSRVISAAFLCNRDVRSHFTSFQTSELVRKADKPRSPCDGRSLFLS
jgi:hypothetical protein